MSKKGFRAEHLSEGQFHIDFADRRAVTDMTRVSVDKRALAGTFIIKTRNYNNC